MLITKLDIVNSCLGSMGESPVNSLDYNNPFISAADLAFKRALMQEQAPGWYYNMETVTIQPTVDGECYVGADVLGISVKENPPWMSLRGRRIYNNAAGGYYHGTKPLRCRVIRLIPLDQLPYHMQSMVQWATVMAFQSSYDADEAKISQAKEDYGRAYTALNSEHVRAVQANGLTWGSAGRRGYQVRRPMGGRYHR